MLPFLLLLFFNISSLLCVLSWAFRYGKHEFHDYTTESGPGKKVFTVMKCIVFDALGTLLSFDGPSQKLHQLWPELGEDGFSSRSCAFSSPNAS